MKKLLLFLALLFLFDTTETKSQRLYIYGAEKVSESPSIEDFVMVGRYIFGVGGDASSDGVFMAFDDSLKNWRKMPVGILGEGDLIATTKGYVVVSSGAGTYLSPDTGRTWYSTRNHMPFAMLPMKDGSFLAGGDV